MNVVYESYNFSKNNKSQGEYCMYRERFSSLLDDEAFYEVGEDVGFDHSLLRGGSLPLATPHTRHGESRGTRGSGRMWTRALRKEGWGGGEWILTFIFEKF